MQRGRGTGPLPLSCRKKATDGRPGHGLRAPGNPDARSGHAAHPIRQRDCRLPGFTGTQPVLGGRVRAARRVQRSVPGDPPMDSGTPEPRREQRQEGQGAARPPAPLQHRCPYASASCASPPDIPQRMPQRPQDRWLPCGASPRFPSGASRRAACSRRWTIRRT